MTPDPHAPAAVSRPAYAVPLAGVLAVFFLLGCAGLVPFAWQAHRDHRVAKKYLESSAEILEFIPITSGVDTRPGRRREPSTRPSFVFRFAVKDGPIVTTRGYDAYGGREAPAAEWNTISPGDRVPCWYDPSNPRQAVLSRRFNPHFYWLLAWPLGIMGFTGLLIRECLRRAAPPLLKGIGKGRRLAWRLPTVASHRAMTGCLGAFAVLLALLTSGFLLAALDYRDEVYRYRWFSQMLGFNLNGWYFVALAALAVTLVFLWAFLVNLRWVALPEPEVEVNATRLLPRQTTELLVTQAGPLRALRYSVLLVCEINGIPGKPPARSIPILERENLRISGHGERPVEFPAELRIPKDARLTRHTAGGGSSANQDLVRWFIRIERKVSARMTIRSDYEILVGGAPS